MPFPRAVFASLAVVLLGCSGSSNDLGREAPPSDIATAEYPLFYRLRHPDAFEGGRRGAQALLQRLRFGVGGGAERPRMKNSKQVSRDCFTRTKGSSRIILGATARTSSAKLRATFGVSSMKNTP